MDNKQFVYIKTILQERSFTKAASKLYIAQSSLSQYVQNIEKKLGTKLFIRNKSGIELTESGTIYIKAWEKIINLEKQLLEDIHNASQLKIGKLTIGISPYRDCSFLSYVLKSFNKSYPEIKIVLLEQSYIELEEKLKKGEVDILLTLLPVNNDDFNKIYITTEELLLAVPNKLLPERYKNNNITSNNNVNYKEIDLLEFRNTNFIMLSLGSMLQELTINLCKKSGFEPNVILESKGIEAVHSMSTQGLGVTIIPSSFVKFGRFISRPNYFSISKFRPKIDLIAAYNKNRKLSKASIEFINVLKKTFQGGENEY